MAFRPSTARYILIQRRPFISGLLGVGSDGKSTLIKAVLKLQEQKVHMKLRQSRITSSNIIEEAIHAQRQYKNNLVLSTPIDSDSFGSLMDDIDTFIFDADGVLWLGEGVIPGSPQLIDLLVKNKKKVIILTNNATKSRATYAKKLEKLGYHSKLDKNWLVNPSAVVADNLSRAGFGKGKKSVYLIGSKGIKEEMDEFEIEYFGDGPEMSLDTSDGSAYMYELELPKPKEQVGAVVIGYEKHFNYNKLMIASNYLTNPDCHFFATNEDETCPGPNPNVLIPDAGPIVAAVKCATNRQPITVGKPNSPAFEYIQRKWNIDPERTIMVGDRTNTDVKFGRDHGLKTLLVLSGCHQVSDIIQNQKNSRFDMVPDFYAKCLGYLVPKTDENANKINN